MNNWNLYNIILLLLRYVIATTGWHIRIRKYALQRQQWSTFIKCILHTGGELVFSICSFFKKGGPCVRRARIGWMTSFHMIQWNPSLLSIYRELERSNPPPSTDLSTDRSRSAFCLTTSRTGEYVQYGQRKGIGARMGRESYTERILCISAWMCRTGVYCTRSGHWLQQHGLLVITDQACNSDVTFKANGKVFHESFCGLGLLFSTINLGSPYPKKHLRRAQTANNRRKLSVTSARLGLSSYSSPESQTLQFYSSAMWFFFN